MFKTGLKPLLAVLMTLAMLVALAGCKAHKYDEEWIIGKTSEEVIEKYGEFYKCIKVAGSDGVYDRSICSYIIKPKRKGFLGTTPAELFSISFDKNGIADRCWVETDGKGG